MNNDSGYWMSFLPQLLNFILYFIASICMAITYVKLRNISRHSANNPLGVVATGFGFYFLGFFVGLLMSAAGLVFVQYLGMIVYHGIQYSQHIFTIIGTVYFVIGAKQLLAMKS